MAKERCTRLGTAGRQVERVCRACTLWGSELIRGFDLIAVTLNDESLWFTRLRALLDREENLAPS